MRNVLITLTLCVLTLTTSNVFAAKYDESKRTERFGLSFYDGAPMYLIYFSRPSGNPAEPSYPPGSTSLRVERLRSDQRLEDMPGFRDDYLGYVWIRDSETSRGICYGFDDSGNLEQLERSNDLETTPWIQTLFREQGPGLMALASTGDVSIDIFDALLKPLQEWLGGALGFWLTIGVVFLGWQYLRRLARGGVAIGGKSAEVEASNDDFLGGFRRRRAEKLAAEQEREKFESFQKAWGAIRELGEADAYATGEAFGLTFTDKVVKSNQILQEAWSRLSEDERRFLANEARALAWQDDLIGEKEKIYRQAAMETALSDLDGVDASSVFSNPFEDATYYDDDNGGKPF